MNAKVQLPRVRGSLGRGGQGELRIKACGRRRVETRLNWRPIGSQRDAPLRSLALRPGRQSPVGVWVGPPRLDDAGPTPSPLPPRPQGAAARRKIRSPPPPASPASGPEAAWIRASGAVTTNGPWGQAESLLPGGQIDSRNSAPAAVTATLSAMSSTGATSNSSQVENFAGASARLVGLSVSTTA